MSNEVLHHWDKQGEQWFVKCVKLGKSFKSDKQFWDVGACAYCGKNALLEMKERKLEREEQARIRRDKSLVSYDGKNHKLEKYL